jgi:uncharacterized membrane protein
VSNFFSRFDSDRIVAAIAAAEAKSSAEIRVHVTRKVPKDLEARALRRFHLLGMSRTELHNGVLVYIAPRARQFRILGDAAIHEKCGADFWKEVAAAMEGHFRKDEFTEGVVVGLELLGAALAKHFPRSEADRDELPNTIDEE